MIEFEGALSAVLKSVCALAAERTLIKESVGKVLAEDIYSKVEMPPFDKSAMDGYAVNSLDVKKAPVKLKCIGILQAGRNFKKKINRGECVKIMTGAPIPKGADSVVMVENTRFSGEYVEILPAPKKWENICFKGEDIKLGQKIADKGACVCVSDIALLAAAGNRYVKTVKFPRVSSLNTGSEIISLGKKLGKNKIYNSNGPQIYSLLKADGIAPCCLGVVRDNFQELVKAVKKGFKHDILLISGGVSAGDYDLVPKALEKAGVKKIFHKVKIKPGKPLYFGKYKKTVIFGVPGNPVSNFSTYILFIRPAIYKMMGRGGYKLDFKEGIIKESFKHKIGRTHFIPVKILIKQGKYQISPLNSRGSADIFTLSKADAFMMAEAETSVVKKNSKVKFITWRSS
ncbi:MAG: gephyrin-like molybdotransferase Glp [Candidatus Omnitrophota bacterium]